MMLKLRLRYLRFQALQMRWQARQADVDFKRRFWRVGCWLGMLSLSHIVAMIIFEDMELWPAIWLTTTTLTTVGYGDLSASTVSGQLATTIFLYVAGIALLAQLAGEYIDWRIQRREFMLKGLWRWQHMKGHILILNTPNQGSNHYLELLLKQIRITPDFSQLPIQLLTTSYPDGLPSSIRKLDVVQYSGEAENRYDLLSVNAQDAKYILVLAEETYERRSDSITLDVLEHLQTIKTPAYIIAECVRDDNYERFKRMGADAILRPVRAYPELMVRAMVAPGTERLLENLFVHDGDHPRRYELELNDLNWGDIACCLINFDLGVPLGYVNKDGDLVTNPAPKHSVSAKALIIMVRHDQTPKEKQIASALSTLN